MPYSPTFVTEPRPGFLPSPVSPSSSSSFSSSPRSKTGIASHSSRRGDYITQSATHPASRYNQHPPSTLSPHSLPEAYHQNQKRSLATRGCGNMQDPAEDSDCCNESTPGRAWKESKQAVPRVRVVGFDITTTCSSKSGGHVVDPGPHRPKQVSVQTPLVTSGSSRRFSAPDRSDILRGQDSHTPADKPRISQFSPPPSRQHRVKSCKHSVTYELDLGRKNLAKAI